MAFRIVPFGITISTNKEVIILSVTSGYLWGRESVLQLGWGTQMGLLCGQQASILDLVVIQGYFPQIIY
jgi:hypothetical protein